MRSFKMADLAGTEKRKGIRKNQKTATPARERTPTRQRSGELPTPRKMSQLTAELEDWPER